MSYDGALISELGVKLYLKGEKSKSVSNIKFFERGKTLEKRWKDCNFGCHGPSYRTLRRPSTWGETLSSLDKIDPMLAGIVDGLKYKTVDQAQSIGRADV